jgi:hypothetical protein
VVKPDEVPQLPARLRALLDVVCEDLQAARNGTPDSTEPLSPRQWEVLQAVADERIRRDVLLGPYEPHLLDGLDVIWTLRELVLRRLVQLQPIGPPHLTPLGRRFAGSHR